MTTTPAAPAEPQADPATPDPQPGDPQDPQPPSAKDEPLGDAGKAALQQEREARKAADKRAKDFEKELTQFKQANMSETEKAVSEAEQRGRSAAAEEFGIELAREKFDALAGRRNPDAKTDDILELVDLKKFLGDDGRPNVSAIQSAVERLVPEASDRPPSFDGGQRKSATPAQNFSDVIRKAAGH